MRNQLTINEYTFTAIVLTLTTTLKKLLQGPKFAIRELTNLDSGLIRAMLEANT